MRSQINGRWSVWLRLVSVALPLAAIFFIIQRIWLVRAEIFARMELLPALTLLAAGGSLYAANNLLLVGGWRYLLSRLGETGVAWKTALRVYGRAQIAKYIPGNFVQFPNRHILGLQAGLRNGPLLGAAVFEIVGILTASSALSLLLLVEGKSRDLISLGVIPVFIASVAFPFVLQAAFSRLPFLRRMDLPRMSIGDIYTSTMTSVLFYLAFFLVSGGILWMVIHMVNGSSVAIPLQRVMLAFSVAWFAGTVTPGAPAGAGVREAILVLALREYIGEPASILTALFSRLVTILGDVGFYLVAQLIR